MEKKYLGQLKVGSIFSFESTIFTIRKMDDLTVLASFERGKKKGSSIISRYIIEKALKNGEIKIL